MSSNLTFTNGCMNLDNQNTQKSLKLLAAQARLYTRAKWWTYAVFITTLLPLILYFLKPSFPNVDYIGSMLGVGGLFLTFLLNGHIAGRIKTAARIQEEFDLGIYEWEWNYHLGADPVIKDIRNRAAGNYSMPEERLPWYTPEIKTISEPSMQVLLCQRENVVWDWQLRKKFSNLLRALFFVTLMVVIAWGWMADESFRLWLSIDLALISGFLYKTFELWQAFQKVGRTQEQTLHQIEAEITSYKKDPKPIPYERLRLFQNNIFQNRKENAVVPDSIFGIVRKVFQNRTSESTKEIIQELKS